MEPLVIGLLAAVLSGAAGEEIEATVLIYAPHAQTVMIDGKELSVVKGPNSIKVPVHVEAGTHEKSITVESESVTYTLPLTVVGKRRVSPWWSLTALPVLAVLLTLRVRRRAGNS